MYGLYKFAVFPRLNCIKVHPEFIKRVQLQFDRALDKMQVKVNAKRLVGHPMENTEVKSTSF
jgi:hypothetical protein